jgi:FkbM family methyltransferase
MAPNISGLHHYKLRLPEGQDIIVDFRDVSAMYWLNHQLNDPFEETGLLAAIRPFLSEKDIFWDIGANSGLLSYNLLKSTRCAEMHLFEPNPKMGKLAAQSLAPFENIQVHPFGFSDKSADFILTIPVGHTTMATLEPDATSRNGNECKVTCRIGDELVFNSGFRPPRVIKIDTEGHELKVISGLSRTIAEYRPIIFFEHISLNLAEVKSLVPKKYSLFTVSDSTGELVPEFNGAIGHNSVLIPQ